MSSAAYNECLHRLVDHIALDWCEDKPPQLPRNEDQWFQFLCAVESFALDDEIEQSLGMDKLSSSERASVVPQATAIYISEMVEK